MAKLNRDWHRRRWVLALLFILLLTVSMMGPTQALSGAVNASVAVMETFAAMVAPDKPTPKPTASIPSTAQFVDSGLMPDFTALAGVAPSRVDAGAGSAAMANPTGAISSASATWQGQAGSQARSFGGGRSPYRGGAGSGLGLGGSGGGSRIESLAGTDEGLAQELAVFDVSPGSPTFAFDPGAADDGSGFLPGGSGGSGPGEAPGGAGTGGSGVPSLGGPFSSQEPAPTPFADGTVPPAVIKDLLDDINVPTPDLSGNAPAASRIGFDLSQVPEPSTFLLVSLGLAALRYRSRQGSFSRQS